LAETLLQRRYVGTGDKAGNSACLFFIFLYTFCYGLMDPVQFIWAAEIFPNEIRAKGVGLTCFSYFLGIITWTTPSPLAFKNLGESQSILQNVNNLTNRTGWKYYFVWFACGLVSLVGVYFLIFETQGKTLEEIGELFGEQVVVHITSDGRGIVEADLDKDIAFEGTHREDKAAVETRDNVKDHE
jgi:hypothetical protein